MACQDATNQDALNGLGHLGQNGTRMGPARMFNQGYGVPETVCTDQLKSHQAAIRELSALHAVDHQQVVSTSRRNNLNEESHRPTRRQDSANSSSGRSNGLRVSSPCTPESRIFTVLSAQPFPPSIDATN